MAITQHDVKDLIDATLKDMPRLPLSLLISAISGCETDEEAITMAAFISKQYTADEILAELQRQNKVLLKFFKKEENNG